MAKYGYAGEDRFRPISAWGYVGYSILFSIPVLGFILLIVFSYNSGHINRRSFARSILCMMLVGIIISAILFAAMIGLMDSRLPAELRTKFEEFRQSLVESVTKLLFTDKDGTSMRPAVRSALLSLGLPAESAEAAAAGSATPLGEKSEVPAADEKLPLGVSSSFKASLDAVETLYDEYFTFMRKYRKAENSAAMLADYTAVMMKYAEAGSKLQAFEDRKLTIAEEAYYTQVVLRIQQKMFEFISED